MDMFEKIFVYKWREKAIILLSVMTLFIIITAEVSTTKHINELVNQIK